MISLLFALYAGFLLVHGSVNSNRINTDLIAAIRDDNNNTCLVFGSMKSHPWYIDICVPIYYMNRTETVTVDLFGENIGCSSGDDAKLFIFPVSTWEECTGLLGRKKTCRFNESSTDLGTGQQKCSYQCAYSHSTLALRMIKLPYTDSMALWKICEATSIFYENPFCRFKPVGSPGGNTLDNRNCWIAAGRRLPTALQFYEGSYLYGILVYYGNSNCSFGNMDMNLQQSTVTFLPDELITEVVFYQDTNNTYKTGPIVVGMQITTNYGNVYGSVYQGEEHRFAGEGLLYFHGRVGIRLDAAGVQFGKC